MRLLQALNLNFPCILTAVGGGGKTSLLFALAREAAGQGRSVIITTTTAMFTPRIQTPDTERQFAPHRMVLGPPEVVLSHPPAAGEILMAAPFLAVQGKKIKGYSPETLARLLSPPAADLVLIEADGARMKPVKAPADHEPVVPAQTRVMAGCIGLDSLGKPLDDRHVHRPEHLAALAEQSQGSPVTPSTLICLICHDQGLFKGIPAGAEKLLILNKAETPEQIRAGRTIIDGIPEEQVPHMVLVTCLASETDPVRIRKI